MELPEQPRDLRPKPHESDRALMVRAHEGDTHAQTALLSRYAAPLWNLAFRATGSMDIASDAVRDRLAARLAGLAERVPPPDRRWIVDLAGDIYRALLDAGLRPERPMRRVRITAGRWDPGPLKLADDGGREARRRSARLRRQMSRAWSRLSLRQRFVLALVETQPISASELAEVLRTDEAGARLAREEAKLALATMLMRVATPRERRAAENLSPGEGEP